MGTSITGYTAEKMAEIADATIVDGNVVGDELILVRNDGVQVNVGNVRGPEGPPGAASGIGDAPADGSKYIRKDSLWVPLSVATDELEDGAVTEAKLGAGAVTQAKIGDEEVTALKLAPNAGVDSRMHVDDVSAVDTNLTSAQTDLVVIPSITVDMGRKIRCAFTYSSCRQTGSAGIVILKIMRGATTLYIYNGPVNGTGFQTGGSGRFIDRPPAGTYTYKLVAATNTSTARIEAGDTYPVVFEVEDVGAA